MEYLETIGMNVRKARDKANMSQQELADNSNIAKSTLQRIEKGTMNPTILMLDKIAQALKIEVEELIKRP